MASERPGMGPGIDRSKSIEDLHHLRLMALLDELVRDKGARKAAQDLDVDHRTLAASLESGRLTRRMRVALDRALLAGGGSPAREQKERNDVLAERLERVEGRVEVVGKDAGQGLAAVQDEVKALRNGQGQVLQRVESRLAKVEGGGGDAGEEEGASGDGDRTPNRESGGGTQAKRRPKLRREFPELATLEPAEDDADMFGDAWALIQEWRELKETHPNRGKGLEWVSTRQRILEVEVALLEEHGLTLPPEMEPLRGLDRGAQLNWRLKALHEFSKRRARLELLAKVAGALSPGRWLRAAWSRLRLARLRWRR